MRLPSIRLRRTLTIRSLMVLIAFVAIGIAGWKAKQHWSECRSGAASMRRLASINTSYAQKLRASLPEAERLNNLRFSPEVDSSLHPVDEDPTVGFPPESDAVRESREHMSGMIAMWTRDAEANEAMGERYYSLEAKFLRLAWRPWIDMKGIRGEVDAIKQDSLRHVIAQTNDLEQLYPELKQLSPIDADDVQESSPSVSSSGSSSIP